MKKFITILITMVWMILLLTLSLDDLTAQTKDSVVLNPYEHQKGKHLLHFGAGFPNKLGALFDGLDLLGVVDGGKASPQLTLNYEYGLNKDIGVGLHLGYYQLTSPKLQYDVSELVGLLCDVLPEACELVTSTVNGQLKVRALTVGGRLAYHRQMFENLDTYGSAVLGYSFLNQKTVSGDNSYVADQFQLLKVPSFVYFTSVGARYYFNQHIALYGEVGYGSIALVNAGITWRI